MTLLLLAEGGGSAGDEGFDVLQFKMPGWPTLCLPGSEEKKNHRHYLIVSLSVCHLQTERLSEKGSFPPLAPQFPI